MACHALPFTALGGMCSPYGRISFCICLVFASVKHFFTWVGKMFFTSHGKEFFTSYGNQIFTPYGKEIFTIHGNQIFTPGSVCFV